MRHCARFVPLAAGRIRYAGPAAFKMARRRVTRAAAGPATEAVRAAGAVKAEVASRTLVPAAAKAEPRMSARREKLKGTRVSAVSLLAN